MDTKEKPLGSAKIYYVEDDFSLYCCIHCMVEVLCSMMHKGNVFNSVFGFRRNYLSSSSFQNEHNISQICNHNNVIKILSPAAWVKLAELKIVCLGRDSVLVSFLWSNCYFVNFHFRQKYFLWWIGTAMNFIVSELKSDFVLSLDDFWLSFKEMPILDGILDANIVISIVISKFIIVIVIERPNRNVLMLVQSHSLQFTWCLPGPNFKELLSTKTCLAWYFFLSKNRITNQMSICCILLVSGIQLYLLFAYPESHKEIWLAILFLSSEYVCLAALWTWALSAVKVGVCLYFFNNWPAGPVSLSFQ